MRYRERSRQLPSFWRNSLSQIREFQRKPLWALKRGKEDRGSGGKMEVRETLRLLP
jgi:hypothetical protein